MSLTDDQIVAKNFKKYHEAILPYLNGSAHSGFTPIGTVISVMGTTAPLNYLACDGTVYNIADYPELAAYFNQQFGASNHFGGNGTTTFAVPTKAGGTDDIYCIASKNIFMDAGMNYSTEEQVVGTWIGGKPLYQKTYTGTFNLPNNTWVNTGIDAPTNGKIKRLVNCIYGINVYDQYVPCVCSFIDGKIKLCNVRDSDYDSATNAFTIQYTKTTD